MVAWMGWGFGSMEWKYVGDVGRMSFFAFGATVDSNKEGAKKSQEI